MGSSFSYRRSFHELLTERQEAARLGVETRRRNAAAKAKRMALADKIVLAIVDRISADIIRPGPKPEERECYVMARELREHAPRLRELVTAILKIDQEEPADGTERD